MSFSTGFYTDKCNVYYECNIEDDKADNNDFSKPNVAFLKADPYGFKTSFFGFYYIYSGELTVYHCGETIKLPEKTLLVCSPDYPLNHIHSKPNTEFVSIQLHASLINTFEKSEGLSKIFYADSIKKRVYTKEMHQDNIIIPVMNSLKSSILQHYNEPFIFSRILTVITEINIIYNRIFGEDEKEIPNIAVRVMDYIERHYTEDLSIDSICEKFKISPSSVHRICKRAFNKSFKEHIAELRLREARALIVKRDYLPSSVAKLVGYKSYSSFFRAYKKAFDISPIEDLKTKSKWPME